MTEYADARPTKRFFLDMITRDISMEDSILDLIDNSIDSFVRTHELKLTSDDLLDGDQPFVHRANGGSHLGKISVTLTADEFSITDDTGGISRDRAMNEVFRFGSEADRDVPSLGVYGIGLKRAIFKLGRLIDIESKTAKEGFTLELDTREWLKVDDWTLPLNFVPGASNEERPGTKIRIRGLHENVVARVKDGTAEARLARWISLTYPFFLGRLVEIELNGVALKPNPIPVGGATFFDPSSEWFKVGGVSVTLLATVADRSQGEWTLDRAGWYIVCNGRVVVSADKTELTGWGVNTAQFVSKYRGFVGLAFFFAEDPIQLPWTTTKRGINQESPVFLQARNRMQLAAKPVLSFLNSFYPSDPEIDPTSRALAEQVKPASVGQLVRNRTTTVFQVRETVPPPKTTVRVQYDAENDDLDRIRRCLRKPRMSAGKVGEHTFKHFLRTECPE